MKGLDKLIRVKTRQLDEQRRQLGALSAIAMDFRNKIAGLDREMQTESRSHDGQQETAHLMGGYIQASLVRREKLSESLREADARVAEAEAEIAEAYRELKKCELLQQRQEEREKAERQRKDRIKEDEVALSMFRQKAVAAGE